MIAVTADDYRNPELGIIPRYSEEGHHLRKIPFDLFYDIKHWYVSNKDRIERETPDPNYFYNTDILHLTEELKNRLDDRIRPLVKEWAKEEVQLSGIYGMRIYRNGSWLKNHFDRPGHILSGILNIDQDVDENWPIFMENPEGHLEPHYLEPGDLMLYESQLVHGRETPLKGRGYANIFVHYQPNSWETRMTTVTQDAISQMYQPNSWETR